VRKSRKCKVTSIIIQVILLLLVAISSTDAACACHNNGQCLADDTCVCPKGFYGLICSLHADTYQVEYVSTPTDVPKVIERLTESLQKFFIYDIERVAPGNVLKLSFNMKLSTADIEDIKREAAAAATSTVSAVNDFDECNHGQSCFDSGACVNTEGSFQCGCENNYEVKDGQCVQFVDNTKMTIYIWIGAVAGILLLMIGVLIFYQRRKTLKGKKLQEEAMKRAAIRKTALSPTNINHFNDQGISPPASIMGYDNVRPFSIQSDAASIYSYSSRRATSEAGYQHHRLSVPVLENYPGYDLNGSPRRFPASLSEQQFSASLPDDNSLTQLATSYPGIIPTTYDSSYNDATYNDATYNDTTHYEMD